MIQNIGLQIHIYEEKIPSDSTRNSLVESLIQNQREFFMNVNPCDKLNDIKHWIIYIYEEKLNLRAMWSSSVESFEFSLNST